MAIQDPDPNPDWASFKSGVMYVLDEFGNQIPISVAGSDVKFIKFEPESEPEDSEILKDDPSVDEWGLPVVQTGPVSVELDKHGNPKTVAYNAPLSEKSLVEAIQRARKMYTSPYRSGL